MSLFCVSVLMNSVVTICWCVLKVGMHACVHNSLWLSMLNMGTRNHHQLYHHVMWVPITTAWCIFRLQVEEIASRYGG